MSLSGNFDFFFEENYLLSPPFVERVLYRHILHLSSLKYEAFFTVFSVFSVYSVALRNDSYTLHKILPNKVDPLVSLMMVEKVPDSTYEMVGGLDKQIKEIKEVIELPVKHPELFEALGIAQPKGMTCT